VTRVAHLWTPYGVVDVAIADEWPTVIEYDGYVYEHERSRLGKPPITWRGRRTGIEMVEYIARFPSNYVFPRTVKATRLIATREITHVQTQSSTRSGERDEREGTATARRGGAPTRDSRQPARAPVSNRRPGDRSPKRRAGRDRARRA
jgi:hypothetical protein